MRKDFFFILSFFVLYILSFGLVRFRTFRFSAWVGADINAGVRARAGRMWQSQMSQWKTQIENDWGCKWHHAQKRWAAILSDFENSSELRFEAGRSELIFGPGWGQSSYSLRDAPLVVGLDGTVSIVRIVSLSPLVENLNCCIDTAIWMHYMDAN